MVTLLGIGTGVGMLVLALGNQGNSTQLAIPKIAVMVAADNLKVGDVLGGSDYRWENWPEEVVPSLAIRENDEIIENLDEMRLRRVVLAGEPIFPSMLVSKDDDAGFLAATLEPNQRAISIPVSVNTSAGGFVRPGDFVDILMTYQVRIEGDREDRQAAMTVVARHASETVLERIQVLAVDQVVNDNRDAAPARTVTVAVTQEQAERLTLAQQMGDLSLSLRSLSADEQFDEAMPAGRGFTADINIGRALQAAAMAAYTSKGGDAMNIEDGDQHGTAIRVYHGATVQNLRVNKRWGQGR
ncbi:MAG: Flp pilus assembly protein CpaB [Pseudomonadota bacterium]